MFLRSIRAVLWRPLHLSLLAEGYALAGWAGEACGLVDQALGQATILNYLEESTINSAISRPADRERARGAPCPAQWAP